MTYIQRRNTKPDKMIDPFAVAIRSANSVRIAIFP